MTEQQTDELDGFQRIAKFEPGYNYSYETGPSRRGIHGMGIRFVLVGPGGATQFLMNTGWVPALENDKSTHHKVGTTDALFPMGCDLGYHWPDPRYDGQGDYACDLLPGGRCYYDGSGLAADPVLRDFIRDGEAAVWRHLARYYRELTQRVIA